MKHFVGGRSNAITNSHFHIIEPLILWAALFLMPVLANIVFRIDMPLDWYASTMLLIFCLVSLYYFDYFYLVPRYVAAGRWLVFLLINVALFVILLGVCVAGTFFFVGDDRAPLTSLAFMFSLLSGFILLLLTALLSVAVRMSHDSIISLRKISDMEKSHYQAELQSLKSQINPHFLFNTLNNIYSLTYVDVPKSQKAILDLSRLLRYTVYDCAADRVPLTSELAFVDAYLKLEGLRLGSNVELSSQLPAVSDDVSIAPLLFLPFIENAFKHGVCNAQPSFIHICFTFDGLTVVCRIVNSSYPKQKSDGSPGVGIQNAIKRLDLLYPKLHTLSLGPIDDGSFQTELRITLS